MPRPASTLKKPRLIGVISDTHGLLRPEAIHALRGCDLILHAGDIGAPDILDDLQHIAPVMAVKGNNDRDHWAEELPLTHHLTIESFAFLLTHDAFTVCAESVTPPVDMIISGHSHKPAITEHNGIVFLNPGSAGPRRFSLPIALARISVHESRFIPEIIYLDI